MEPLGSFPRVLNVLPREKIEGSPRNFLKANPRPHRRPDQRPKTRGAAGLEGFWPLVWPRMWPRVCVQKISKGAFNICPREFIEYSKDLPRAPFTMIPPRPSHRFSFFLPNALLYSVNCEEKNELTIFQWNPRELRGECQQQPLQTLTVSYPIFQCVRQKECPIILFLTMEH